MAPHSFIFVSSFEWWGWLPPHVTASRRSLLDDYQVSFLDSAEKPLLTLLSFPWSLAGEPEFVTGVDFPLHHLSWFDINIPAGALSLDHSHWLSARKNFLFPVKALSRVFRGKFLDLLKQACDQGKIQASSSGLKELRKKNWVVYAKKPFGSPQTILDYLGRYLSAVVRRQAGTHCVALSNDRILSLKNGQVTFSYRDRKDKDRLKSMPLDAQEFIRRFLLHILPDDFMRIRHFGFLANRAKKHSLLQCRKLLGLNPALPKIPKRSAQDLLLVLTGIDLSRCPRCQKGTMIVIG